MALVVIHDDDASQLVAAVSMQLQDKAAQARTLELIRARVRQFERRYNVASDDLHGAIDAGKLEETADVCQWILDYNLLLRAGEV
jgi:uncharacterized membrane protein